MSSADTRAGGSQTLPPAIDIDRVSKSFTSRDGTSTLALKDVSVTVADGSFVTLLGPSGCGKTTVLRLVDGLLGPDQGEVRVFGKPPMPGPDIALVFQSFRLIPWETVRSNVDFALRSLPLDAAKRAERVEKYIAMVGLSRFGNAFPRELSGGMKQRVALARALACEPRLLLMDEPFASIDAQTRELMQIELLRILSLRKSGVLFVTHSVDEALLLSDRIVLMGPRPGRVVEDVEVDLPRPRWSYDVRAHPRFVELRSYLAGRMYDLVMNDPNSEFFGRDMSEHLPS